MGPGGGECANAARRLTIEAAVDRHGPPSGSSGTAIPRAERTYSAGIRPARRLTIKAVAAL
jgi:hypothetical protein